MKASQYCLRLKLATNCAQSSGAHSVIIVRGRFCSSPGRSKVVGVCSLEGASEEVSESVICSCVGEATTLRSYSSSASESAWYGVPLGNAIGGGSTPVGDRSEPRRH